MTDASGQRRRKERYSRLEGKKDEYWKYTPLVKAALIGDWETAQIFFKQYPNAITDPITNESETVLHMATGTGPLAINFVAELLSLEQMTPQALAHRDIQGNTPLHLAAWVANTDAAVLLVQRNPGLLSVREKGGWLPVHYAAINAKKETLCYLLEVTLMDDASMDVLFFSCGIDQPSGPELLIHVITSGFYDVALDLVHRYPQLAISHAPNDDDCGLGALARKVDAFRSGTQLNFWECIIYAYQARVGWTRQKEAKTKLEHLLFNDGPELVWANESLV
ncbi:hypothetical protein Vadar_030769 [Vaccinium darrowii]|uniref:Uncharacterized protein n=1 Tax=Vaccinium darrowii TaxID=229202 RepID=A0ACB7YHL8_9ERIC|nr:hypothetical protein Vadar_030769 [Vaccinium darrowii]